VGLRRASTAALLAMGVLCGPASAAPGDLDPSFGVGGKTRVDFGGRDFGGGLALQPDGKLLIAGTAWPSGGTPEFAVARLDGAGNLDASFGAAGRATVSFGMGVSAFGGALALQPDGMLVLTGEAGDDFAAARLRGDGTPDPAFGGGQPQRLNLGPSDHASGVALLPDGKLILAGWTDATGENTFAVGRLLATGFLDTSGDFNGWQLGWSLPDFPGGSEFAADVAIQTDGKTVAVGTHANDFAVVRLTPSGLYDPAFGNPAGRTTISFGPVFASLDEANAVALQPDGKIVVAGRTNIHSCCDFAIARLNPDGSPDDSFGGGDGRAEVEFLEESGAQAVALQADGKIILAGYVLVNGDARMAVVRLQPDGLLDSTFGAGGMVTIGFGVDDRAVSVAVRGDGRIVIGGTAGSLGDGWDHAIAQLQGGPTAPGGGGPGGTAPPAPICAGRRATIVGTASADRLIGTAAPDVIAALGGADTIRSQGGDDIVCAGAGADTVRGGAGGDRLLGQSGIDILFGERGRDRVLGATGGDLLFGGPGVDLIRGGPGADLLRGGMGADLLFGGPGADRLIGGPGRDRERE
jgi:uncharacterized delta-60 repeat protein